MHTSRAASDRGQRGLTRPVVGLLVLVALVGAGLAAFRLSAVDDGGETVTVPNVTPPALEDQLDHRLELRIRGRGGSVTVEAPDGVRVVNAGSRRSDDLFWSEDGLVVSLEQAREMRVLLVVAGHPDRIADWEIDASDAGSVELELSAMRPDGRTRSLVEQRVEGVEVVHVDGRDLGGAEALVGDSPLGPLVLAHYVPWYPNADYSSYNDEPLERFSTRDVDAVEATIREARAVGLDGFGVSYWGLPHEDFVVYMEAAARVPGWKTVVILETKIANHRASSETPPDASVVASWLGQVLDRFVDADTLVRVDGAPVVFAYRSDLVTNEGWQEIRAQLAATGHSVFVIGGEARREALAVLDGTFVYNSFVYDDLDAAYRLRSELTRTHHLVHPGVDRKVWVGTVAPGMNTANPNLDHRYVGRRAGVTLRSQWETVVEHDADVVLVVSWNEFIEDTAIMPSPRWGRRYVSLLEDLMADT